MSENPTDLAKLSPTGQSLVQLKPVIFSRWEKLVRAKIAEARAVTHPILIDTLPAFIVNVAETLSPDFPQREVSDRTAIAEEHGNERARLTAYNIENIVSEYQILRKAIIDTLLEQKVSLSEIEARTIHSCIDDAIRVAIITFTLVHNSIRDRFVATLSHDLRNPLAAAAMSAELILKRTQDPDVQRLATKIAHNHRRVDSMIQDLLDVTIVSSEGRMQLKIDKCDIKPIIDECVAQASSLYQERFKVDAKSCLGYWDAGALKRALDNLISNATKYGEKESPITLRSQTEEGRIVISVHNVGAPIPLADQEGIFQIFRRTASAEKTKGWGLGLALVRGVAESHGGSIILDSGPERGTTFTIDIPIDCRPFDKAPVS